ncbi:MAG: preprotein translocase subunit SecG [Mariprofundaceae bacterium]|nr:preprotein translocase subunit SecG [Mariprofundaceae bacterium]
MTILIVTLHVLAAIILIVLVLIQRGEGANMGVSFGGGGAQTLFGSRGSGSFLGKVTGGMAALFMVTSLTLAFFSQQQIKSVAVAPATTQTAEPQDTLPPADGQGGFDPSKLKANEGDGLPTAN